MTVIARDATEGDNDGGGLQRVWLGSDFFNHFRMLVMIFDHEFHLR